MYKSCICIPPGTQQETDDTVKSGDGSETNEGPSFHGRGRGKGDQEGTPGLDHLWLETTCPSSKPGPPRSSCGLTDTDGHCQLRAQPGGAQGAVSADLPLLSLSSLLHRPVGQNSRRSQRAGEWFPPPPPSSGVQLGKRGERICRDKRRRTWAEVGGFTLTGGREAPDHERRCLGQRGIFVGVW